MISMNKKVVLAVVALVLIIGIGVVYAQESGYFFDITNSNANINTAISNSTVIENAPASLAPLGAPRAAGAPDPRPAAGHRTSSSTPSAAAAPWWR